jgi:hypothetical protein
MSLGVSNMNIFCLVHTIVHGGIWHAYFNSNFQRLFSLLSNGLPYLWATVATFNTYYLPEKSIGNSQRYSAANG